METKVWLERRFLQPVVIVCAADEVEASCERNGLSFIQLLRPFAQHTSDLYARVGDRSDPSVIRNFGVRLFRPDTLREMDPRSRGEHFSTMLRNVAPIELAFGEQLDSALSAILGGASQVDPVLTPSAASVLLDRSYASWHEPFLRDYVNIVRCSYFDTIDHPVSCIIGLSSASTVPLSAMVERARELERQARSVREGVPCMDDDWCTYFVVVHDVTNGPPLEEARRIFSALQTQLGPTRTVFLRINSLTADAAVARKPPDPSLWVDANTAVDTYATNGSGKRYRNVTPVFGTTSDGPDARPLVTGCALDGANVDELRSFMGTFLSHHLLPFLERRLRQLMASVSERRQTALGRVAAWFRKDDGKPREVSFVASADGSPTKYLHTSVEMQMRRAGDIAMMLRDFDTATYYFRLCRDDLNGTLGAREFNRYLIAAAQDAIGLCQYFQGKLGLPAALPGTARFGAAPSAAGTGVDRGGECRLELARDEYQRCTVHSYSFRTSLILFAICRGRSPPANDRALSVLLNVIRSGSVSSNKMYSAIVHDLAASCVLFLNAPMPASGAPDAPPPTIPPGFAVQTRLRHYARYVTFAGSAFIEAGQHEMALRCYLRALKVLQRTTSATAWPMMFEHAHNIVAMLYGRLERPLKALAVSTVLIGDGSSAYASAASGLRNADQYWVALKDVVSKKGLARAPHLAVPQVVLPTLCVGVDAFGADEVTEAECRALGDAAGREWRALENAARAFYNEKTSLAFPRAAPLTSALSPPPPPKRISTPLGEPVTISIELRNPLGGAITVERLSALYMPAGAPESTAAGDVIASITIAARATQRVVLTVAPPVAGEYAIVGFQWSVAGVDGQLLLSTREAVLGQRETLFEYALDHPEPAASCDRYVRFHVASPAARLVADVEPPLPPVMRDGQLHRAQLVLRNIGSAPAGTITLQRSPANAHIVFFEDFSAAENNEAERPLALAQPAIDAGAEVRLGIVVRAQFGGHLPRCSNFLPLLVSYNANAPPSPATVAAASPAVATPASPVVAVSSPVFGSGAVRLHRLLRRCVVRQAINVNSIVLPPTGAASLSSSSAGSSTVSAGSVNIIVTNMSQRADAPLRVSRLLAVHQPTWGVAPLLTSAAVGGDGGDDDDAAINGPGCLLTNDQSVSLGVAISRRCDVAIAVDASDGSAPPVVDTTCIGVTEATATVVSGAACERIAAAVSAALGPGVTGDTAMWYFFTRAAAAAASAGGSAGSIGDYASGDDGDFSFYLDKAGGKRSEEEVVRERVAAERRQFGRRLAVFPPVCFAVAWSVDDGSGGGGGGAPQPAVGQVFHVVDVFGRLLRTGAVREWVTKHVHSLASASRALSAPEHVAAMTTALVAGSSLDLRRGVIVYSGCPVERVVTNTPGAPYAAFVRVRATFTAFTTLPVALQVLARSTVIGGGVPSAVPALAGPAITFVGRTLATFVLLPHESHTVEFSAQVFGPGVVNCNSFSITPLALRMTPGMVTGAAPPSVDTVAQRFMDRFVIIGGETAWLARVRFTPQQQQPVAAAATAATAKAPIPAPLPVVAAAPAMASSAETAAGTDLLATSASMPRRQRGMSLLRESLPTLHGSTFAGASAAAALRASAARSTAGARASAVPHSPPHQQQQQHDAGSALTPRGAAQQHADPAVPPSPPLASSSGAAAASADLTSPEAAPPPLQPGSSAGSAAFGAPAEVTMTDVAEDGAADGADGSQSPTLQTTSPVAEGAPPAAAPAADAPTLPVEVAVAAAAEAGAPEPAEEPTRRRQPSLFCPEVMEAARQAPLDASAEDCTATREDGAASPASSSPDESGQ